MNFRRETGKGWGHHELNARIYNSRCDDTFRQTIFDCDLELVKKWTLDMSDYPCTAAQLGDNGTVRAKIFNYLNSYENVNSPDGTGSPYTYNEQSTRKERIYNVLETGGRRVAEAYGVSQAFFRPLTEDSGILFWRNGSLSWYDAVGNCDPSENFRFREVSCRIAGSDYVPEWRAEEQSASISIPTEGYGNGLETKDWLYCDNLQKTSKWDYEMWIAFGIGNIFLPFLALMDNTHAQLGDTLTGMVYLGNNSDFSTGAVHGRQVAFRYLVWGGEDAAHMDEYEAQAQKHVLDNIPFGQFYR